MPVANEPNIADWIIAGAEVVAALAAAAAAWLAMRAARSSSETAREVRAAYAAAYRPNLTVTGSGYLGTGGVGKRPFGVTLMNSGAVDAVDVEVTAETSDGRVSKGHAGLMPAHTASPWERSVSIALDPVPANLPADRPTFTPDLFLTLQRTLRRVTVVSADNERRGRWERVFEPTEFTEPISPSVTRIAWVLRSERLL